MLFNTKFDLVISLGEDCACSSYLRRCKLQEYSYPFDWLTKASLKNRILLLVNNFNNFLEKEDLFELDKSKFNITDRNCDYYGDSRYDFYYYHDFKAGVSFSEEYHNVKAKYDRRIARLYSMIDKSDKILFVWWSRDKHEDILSVQNYYNELCKRFENKHIYIFLLLNMVKQKKIYI